ncbi:MAG: rRNA maturation RNase YbeY [Clostridia bacterium]|nr:rRNA maturation RNase YbeY [Clostridia bacterium]MBQ8792878.1 rRNA maturation RNase YbeY [Clostridia bacterium]
MIINFEGVGHRYKKLIKKIYQKALELTDNDIDGLEITVSFVKGDKIREYNKQYRKVDRVTDVLSFPMLNINYSQKVSQFMDDVLPNGVVYLGDVVICKKVAKRQAKEYGHSLKREVGFLALHGLLHVLGYDHIEKEDEVVMMAKSDEILSALGIERKRNV